MKRKPRRVKEQGSFLKRQLKGSERSGAFKQPWEGGGVLAGVQAAVPSGHSFLLNAAAPGPLLLLFQAAVESFPSPASEPRELCSVSSLAARLPPPGPARRFDHGAAGTESPEPPHSAPPGRRRQQPLQGLAWPKIPPPAFMETPVCHHILAQGRQLLQGIGGCSAGGRRARGSTAGPAKWERASPVGAVGKRVWKGLVRVPTPGKAMWCP